MKKIYEEELKTGKIYKLGGEGALAIIPDAQHPGTLWIFYVKLDKIERRPEKILTGVEHRLYSMTSAFSIMIERQEKERFVIKIFSEELEED